MNKQETDWEQVADEHEMLLTKVWQCGWCLEEFSNPLEAVKHADECEEDAENGFRQATERN